MRSAQNRVFQIILSFLALAFEAWRKNVERPAISSVVANNQARSSDSN
jgi:hypothetical protein